jgi:hypothetical protein
LASAKHESQSLKLIQASSPESKAPIHSRQLTPEEAGEEFHKILRRFEGSATAQPNMAKTVDEYLAQLKRLNKWSKRAHIHSQNHGQLINFRYAGELEFDGARVFYRTNELYPKDFLSKISQIDEVKAYFGILGAGEQHIPHISALQKLNNIESIRLCEVNVPQIFSAMMAFQFYNNAARDGRLDTFKIGGVMEAPALKNPVNVEIAHADIRNSIANLEPNTYFIHTSSLFSLPVLYRDGSRSLAGGSWFVEPERNRFLKRVASAPNIRDGSKLFVSSSPLPAVSNHYLSQVNNVLLNKENGTLRVCASDREFDTDALDVQLARICRD